VGTNIVEKCTVSIFRVQVSGTSLQEGYVGELEGGESLGFMEGEKMHRWRDRMKGCGLDSACSGYGPMMCHCQILRRKTNFLIDIAAVSFS
jgi:hypothetical protein